MTPKRRTVGLLSGKGITLFGKKDAKVEAERGEPSADSLTYDVFIGWSGDLSREIAEATKESIEDFFADRREVSVFVSTQDISAGVGWYEELRDVLRICRVGIIVLTKENLHSPWVNFEAGALAMGLDKKRVIPLLVGVELPDMSPLQWLENVALDEAGYERLMLAVNVALDGILRNSRVKQKAKRSRSNLFDALRQETRDIVAGAPIDLGTDLVYVGAPMASIPTDEQYREFRNGMMRVVAALRESVSTRVHFAGELVEDRGSFEGSVAASQRDIKLIEEAEFVAVVYPSKLPSSVLIETGYALARKKSTALFVAQRADLPFLASGVQAWSGQVRVYEYGTIEELIMMIRKNGRSLFR